MKRRIFIFLVLLFHRVIEVDAHEVVWVPGTLVNSFQTGIAETQVANLKLHAALEEKETATTLLSLSQPQPLEEHFPSGDDFQYIVLYAMLASVPVLLSLLIVLAKSRQKTRLANRQLAAKNEEIRRKNEDILKRHEETQLQYDAINAQRKALEEMNQVKDKMFSIIAHDFRSPLNTVQGVLNLLHMDVLSSEELKSMLPHLTIKVDYSINLLDNLLNWARTQMNGLKVNTITFTLDPEIEETVGVMSQLARQKSIHIEKKIPKGRMVQADPDMIQLVVRNLLSNAIKFTSPGGVIQISAEENDSAVIVAVSDTGVGMDQASLQKLFKQTGYSTKGTAQEKGTGLGLKLCSEFIRRNGGEIWVESKADEGTTFYFTVPLAEVLEESSCSQA